MLATRARKIISFQTYTSHTRVGKREWNDESICQRVNLCRRVRKPEISFAQWIELRLLFMHDTIPIEHTLKMPLWQKLWRPRAVGWGDNCWTERRARVHPHVSSVLFSEPKQWTCKSRAWKRKWHHESPKDTYRNWTPKFLRPSNWFRRHKKNHIMEIKTKVRNKCSSLRLSVHFCFSRWSVRVVFWKRSFWDKT